MFTQTRPWPPPGAGGLAAASLVVGAAGAGLAAAGLADAEVRGLNRSPRVDLRGDADTAGLAAVSVFAFLRPRFSLGEAAGDSPVEGDAAFSAGEGDAEGDPVRVGD